MNCSLVCSHWLYYVYNTRILSIGHYNFQNLILNTIKYNVKNNDSSVLRIWQRLTKLKSLWVYWNYNIPGQTQLLLDKLSILKNVEKIEGSCWPDHLAIIKIIIQNCKENIKHYGFSINDRDRKQLVLSPLVLANAKHVSIKCLYFYIIWFDKCQELALCYVRDIDKKWCNFVINNCDCSNIKSLIFTWKTFVQNDFINTKNIYIRKTQREKKY